MKRISLLLLFAQLALTGLIAQKVEYGENVQKRVIGSFHAIETSAGIEVLISKGNKEELAIGAAEKEYVNEIKTVVEGGVLKISRSTNWSFWTKWKNWKVKVYVSYTQLDAVKANSGGSIKGTDISVAKLTAKLSSGGSIILSGNVEELTIDGSSGADFKGYAFTSSKCKVDVSSGADVQITVSKEISARANSGGSVMFKGEGLIRDINVNSGGSVKRVN